MNAISLASPTLILPSTAPNTAVEVSAQAESSAMQFLLSPEEGDSSTTSEVAAPIVDGLTAENAQPLMESLQAQLSYRQAIRQGQNSDRLVADAKPLSLVDMPRVDLALSASKYRARSEPVTDDSAVIADAPHQSEQETGIAISSLFFFPPPIERSLTGQSEQTSRPLRGTDSAAPPLVVEQILADVPPADALNVVLPAGETVLTTPSASLKAGDPSMLTLPLTLNRDQTGYAQPLVTALSGHIAWQITQHQQSVELQLHPAELGAMTITLHMNAGALQLHIHAEVPETQQLVQQTANELKESLTLSQGGQVAVDVSSQGHQQRRQAPQPQNPKVISANHLSLTDTQASATDHSILITL